MGFSALPARTLRWSADGSCNLGEQIHSWGTRSHLGATGFESQQTEEPVSADRPNNLFDALPGDRGACGAFGNRSYKSSVQTWISENRLPLAAASMLLIATAVGGLRKK